MKPSELRMESYYYTRGSFLPSFQPILEEKLKIQDTCGVHNLHGMPGILGAIVGAVTAALATMDVYGEG